MLVKEAISCGRAAMQGRAWLWFAVVLAGCTSQMEPAQKIISDIYTSITAASPEAAVYIPQQLREEQARFDALRTAFDRQDYESVLRDGPSVLLAADGLAIVAGAKKSERLRAQNAQWTSLAEVLPENVTAVQNRIDALSGKKAEIKAEKKAGTKAEKKPAAPIDLDAARASLSGDFSLWSKAQAAFAIGNMDEAIDTAKVLDTRLDALAGALQVKLSVPAAVTPAP